MSKVIELRGKLGKGKVTIVDDSDYELLNKYKWYCNKKGYVIRIKYNKRIDDKWYLNEKGYAVRNKHRYITDDKSIFMHRFILGLTDTNIVTDHKNHIKLDNRRENIRACTQQENCMNKKKQKNYGGKECSSSYKGVSWQKDRKKWRAYITHNDKQINLGYFISELEAARAYDKKALELFGEYSLLNFPN